MNVYFLLMLLSETFAAVSQILLKKSSDREYPSVIREYLNPYVITGYGLLGISMLITIYCYRGIGYLGVVVLEPLSYILVMFLSRLVFKETISARRLLGMLLIIGGIALFHL